MNILFLSTLDDYWGGSEVLWTRTARLLHDIGHTVEIAVYERNNLHLVLDSLKNRGIKFHFLKSLAKIQNSSLWKKGLYSLRRKIYPDFNISTLINRKFDCIVVSQADTFEASLNNDFYALLSKSKSKYYLISQLNYEHSVLSGGEIGRSREIFGKAEKIVFVSQRNKEVAERQIARKISNAIIIDNPFNINDFSYMDFPCVSQTIKFASVARLDVKFKAQDLLFRVMASEKWKNREWELHLFGQGKDKDYIEKLTRFYGIEKQVKFRGHICNIRRIWEECHILVLPSIAEGKPLALEEAMICGRPAVVTDVGGNTELIQDNITGIVAKAPTFVLIDEAMERAWQNRRQWEKMGKSAHEWAIQHIDLKPEKCLINLLINTDVSL